MQLGLVVPYVKAQKGRWVTSNEISTNLKLPLKTVRTALLKLTKSRTVERGQSRTPQRHFHYRYRMATWARGRV